MDQANQVLTPIISGETQQCVPLDGERTNRFYGTMVSVDMGWLFPLTEVAISKVSACFSVDLWVSVKVTHTLDVHHNQLMTRTLKCEVAEGLCRGQQEKVVVADQIVN